SGQAHRARVFERRRVHHATRILGQWQQRAGRIVMSVVALIQAIVREEMNRLHVGDLGVVTSVVPHGADDDRENYEWNVLLEDAGLELRKVPVATPSIGSAAIPNIDDLVLVTFVGGDVNQPVVIGRLYNDQQRPPINQSNELAFHLPLDADEDAA